MSDARALLAAERKARRISHPYLTYTKSGQLLCNVCQLNVKSEALWEGHLKSANHRKNAKSAQEATSKKLKRKLDDIDEDEENGTQLDEEGRKKPKSRAVSLADENAKTNKKAPPPAPERGILEDPTIQPPEITARAEASTTAPEPDLNPVSDVSQPPDPSSTVDEDEWAAFEREVAPLAQADYSAATISAAPMSAEQLARQKEEDRRKQQEDNAEAEKEEEEGRVDAELEIMEELSERVRKLREKREALRVVGKTKSGIGEIAMAAPELERSTTVEEDTRKEEDDNESEDDDNDEDDWYT